MRLLQRRKKPVQMSHWWWMCLEVELEQGWAEWHHSASGLGCCACSVAGCHQGSVAAEGSCVLLIQMRNAQQHRMHQRLAV